MACTSSGKHPVSRPPPFGARHASLPPQPPEPLGNGVSRRHQAWPRWRRNRRRANCSRSWYVVKETGEDLPDPSRSGRPTPAPTNSPSWLHNLRRRIHLRRGPRLPGYSGRNFAPATASCTWGINYRVGIEGLPSTWARATTTFGLPRPDRSPRVGARRNIAAFSGGDPARVTIFGQSGGGVSVHCCSSPCPPRAGCFAGADSPVRMLRCRRVRRRRGPCASTRQVAKEARPSPPPRTASAEWPVGGAWTSPQDGCPHLRRFAAVGLALGDKRSLLLSPFRGVHGTAWLPKNPRRVGGWNWAKCANCSAGHRAATRWRR